MNRNDGGIDVMTKRRVLVLGGGFGGTYAAQRLDRTLATRSDVDVVLVRSRR
jgi:NADH dehydrogenase FAD-containing subunit